MAGINPAITNSDAMHHNGRSALLPLAGGHRLMIGIGECNARGDERTREKYQCGGNQ
jgi:hypothetical protein